MNAKHQQLIFDKGITFVPSDAVCSDNALSEERGMIYEDGEHKVIQNPVQMLDDEGSAAFQLLHVHTYNNEKRYLYIAIRQVEGTSSSGGISIPELAPCIVWGYKSGSTVTLEEDLSLIVTDADNLHITTVGKSLIISDENGLHYYLWKENTYKSLGQNIPMQKVTFTVQNTAGSGLRYDEIRNSLRSDGIFNEASNPTQVKGDKIEDFNNLVLGLYAKNKKSVANTKRFCRPFLVRTALRLYDDTYVHISQPILMLPCMTENSVMTLVLNNTTCMATYCRSLKYQNESFVDGVSIYEDWTDIVKDIVIFITPGVEIYDLSVDQLVNQTFDWYGHVTIDGVIIGGTTGSSGMTLAQANFPGCSVLTKRSKEDIAADIAASSVFYKLCSVGLFETGDHLIDDKIDKHYLENLETHEFLDTDDYFSNSTLHADTLYSYNGRLNLANVRRSVFEGYDYFFPFAGFGTGGAIGSGYTGYCRFYVTVETDSGERIIKHEAYSPYFQGVYFFYPDSRAKHVQIFREHGSTHSDQNPYHRLLDEDLKEHTGLHGAYYFKGMPTVAQDTHETYNTTAAEPTADENVLETLASYIVTSDVNNPFVFRAEGYNKVGNGKIIGIGTQTQALSQGQFGQFPLIVFTSEGIWAMTVDSTGMYSSIYPMSREVCNNPKSILQTDNAVFFSSDKGLMVVNGSQVKCVSEQLSGKTDSFLLEGSYPDFNQFLKTCHAAYDYKNSLVWLFAEHSITPQKSWVYSIRSGTFCRSDFTCIGAVNDYPDYLLSTGYGRINIYSFTERPDVNSDTSLYNGLLITRPLKLENAIALKSIMQMKHIHNIQGLGGNEDNSPSLDFRIYGSNNLTNWVEVSSLTGVPWKYYRFKYWFENLRATDRFSGTIIETQERRVNKLR